MSQISQSHTKIKRAGLLMSSALASFALMPAAAIAQNEEAAQQNTRDVVVVTARQKEENLQDVPLAVTAFDAEAIARKNIENLDDVARFTAGFAFEDGQGGFGFPTIRGQSQLFTTAREQPTAVFLNGVYLPRSWLVDLGVQDLERVEIVKGPQSSRYGRNAFAGAINYISQSADLNDMQAGASVTVGNHERLDYGVSLSLPLIADRLAIRGSFDHTENDGTWENTHPNNGLIDGPSTDGNVGGVDRQAYSINVEAEPVDGLRISARYNGFDLADEATPTYWLNSNVGDGNCGTEFDFGGAFPIGSPGGPRLFCGTFGVMGDTVEMEPRAYGRRVDADIYSVGANWDVNDMINVSYLFGHIEASSNGQYTTESDQVNCGGIFNADGNTSFLGTLCNFQGGLTGTVEYDQHELRASFDLGALDLTLGGFYMDGEDRPVAISVNVPPLATVNDIVDPVNSSFPDNIIFGLTLNNTEVNAIFGEAVYTFFDGAARLGAEVRYTEEELTSFNLRVANDPGLNETFKFTTPRFTFEYDLNDDAMLYATVARGAKAGGFNAGANDPALRTYDPEFNWTYEVGAKTILGGVATVNAAAYLTQWESMQVTASDPNDPTDFSQVLIQNLGDATVIGAELEAVFDVSDNLTFDGTLSYSESTFDEGTNDLQFVAFRFGFPPACDGIVCDPTTGDIGGNDLPRTPRFMASAGGEWRAPLNIKDGEYFIRADVSYQDEFFANTINSAKSPSRTLVNARAGVDIGRVDVALWARNLLDEKYVSTSTAIVQSGGANLFGAYYGQRRTFGLTASFNY